jgi:cytochrome c551/c552
MKLFLQPLALVALFATLSCANEAQTLFEQKCVTCHTYTRPADTSTMVAPPIKGVMFHLRDAFKSNEELKAHIEMMVMQPDEAKAICPSVARFGLMPSQKEMLSAKELEQIAQWLVTTY